jgi:hypothetical protein
VKELFVIWTMDCEPVSTRKSDEAPRSWNLSARSIDAFCSRLLVANYLPTLFIMPECAEEHEPMFEEIHARGGELALMVDPPQMRSANYSKHLASYSPEEQRGILESNLAHFEQALGLQPRSLRTGGHSASDQTYRIAYELGFRQGTLSNPGQDRPRYGSSWVDAPVDAHLVDGDNRLAVGRLPFLEVPPTVDATQVTRMGYPWQMRIEVGTYEEWLKPIAESQLERMERENQPFRVLYISTRNGIDYAQPNNYTQTLDDLIDYVDSLSERYELIPVTLVGAHARYRRMQVELAQPSLEQ